MPTVKLPRPENGMGVEELTNLMFRYYRELEYVLGHLDSDNVLRAKVAEIAELYTGNITTDQITAGTAKIALALVEDIQAENIITNTFISNSIVTNTLVTQSLYALKGYIAELTVDSLDTSDKVANYLTNSKADVNYQQIYDQHFKWITATYAGDVDGQDNKVQLTDRNGSAVYWIDDTHTGTTMDVTDYPVYTYVYDELTKLEIYFDLVDEVYTPIMVWGAGTGNSEHPEYGRGFDFKDTVGRVMRYITSNGVVQDIRNGENGVEITGDASNNYYSATNTTEVTVNSAGETVVCTREIAFPIRSKAVINFSCKITTSGGALVVKAKVYVGGVALIMEPEAYQASADKWVLSFTDDKKGIAAGVKSVDVKLITDTNSGTIAIGQSKMIVHTYPDYTDGEPGLISAATNTDGTIITLTFDKPMVNPIGKHAQFLATVASVSMAITAIALNANIYKIDLTLESTVSTGQAVTISYTAGNVMSINEYLLESFSGQNVTNNVVNLYQQWSGFPQSPVSILEYPYQAVLEYTSGGYPYLIVSTQPIYCNSGTLFSTSGTFRRYKYSAGWVYEGVTGSGPIISNYLFRQANNDIYTDSTLTTVRFAKTTE